MTENFEGVSVKKWVILGVCVCALLFALMPHFTAKHRDPRTREEIAKGLPPLPPDFEKLPQEMKEMLLKERQRLAR